MNEFFPSVLERGHGEVEVRFRNFQTGDAHWMAYKVVTLRDAAGRPVGFATVSQDVTERKRLADNLRTLAANLAEADRRKTEFLALLAHELRNPLAPISNAVQTLRLADNDPVTIRATTGMLARQVAQMVRLVDDLLDMSRITRGKIELRSEPTELAPIVTQAVEAVRPMYENLQHQLMVTVPSEPIFLNADRARLAQVIGNLLNNAGKFTEKGGQIALTVTVEGQTVEIRVRDNGVGIAPEDQARVFDMFSQVDTSLERSRDGLGIGLTLVRNLVEIHGGTVSVQSDGHGRGSEFTVRLPLLVDIPESHAPTRSVAPPTTARRRVLIVDDSEDGAESLALLLQVAGHETQAAYDGYEAVAIAERMRPDAILLDIGLPGLNGYDVCRRIRQTTWGAHVLMVALTGWGQDDDRQRSRDAGFDQHLVKPVDHDVLLSLLATLSVTSAESSGQATI
jgi:signal transduction histidine kinase/ActR/RegA family two-component response regulator